MKIAKKNIIRVALSILLMVIFCPSANAGSSQKFEFLLRFFDLNEAAFAYHRHCVSTKQETINQTFLKTLEYVADELFAEAKKDEPRMDPEYIKTKILERRSNLQYRLDLENMKNGCRTPETEMAKAHYEEFSRYNRREISRFIDKKTGG